MTSPDNTHGRGREVLDRILLELEHGHRRSAARMFSDACERGLVADDAALVTRLVEAIGKEHAEELVDGFSRRSCFYCRRGLEKCVECDGAGVGHEGEVCPPCLGIGIIRCDFCDGTGLAPIDSVPAALCTLVVLQRAKFALSALEKILEKPVPEPPEEGLTRALKWCALLLLDMNKLLGVLENTVMSGSDRHGEITEAERQKMSIVQRACIKLGATAQRRAREILALMADLAERKAGREGVPPRKRMAAVAAARFYRSLSEDPVFAGTMLEHPFLWAAVDRSGAEQPD